MGKSYSTNSIRRSFLDYFVKAGHEEVSSSPLIPDEDPTLLFANSGMVQFKNIFTGAEKSLFSTATTSQKCLRAGGKHNDLENVGYTARHHTFFEMLGNFSFGDYFKEKAIEYAWNLVTNTFELKKENLLVTVFEEDTEAFLLWKKISGLEESKILKINSSDNFWSMGDTGPCGPCSEIFYDHGSHIKGGMPGSSKQEGDRYIEIWNLVFMQYEMHKSGKRSNLPSPSIDTGMGLERMAAVLQGVNDNYEIDLFKKLIEDSINIAGFDVQGDDLNSHKVIVDHLRASSFLIADGILPTNEGRGYVLRRIMRRAMRHIHKLGIQETHFWKLVDCLEHNMGEAFPELSRAKALIISTLKNEETKFKETLERGMGLLEKSILDLSSSESFSGDIAFKLYDTYGFPIDLTEDVLRSKGHALDMKGFQKCMKAQQEVARASWAGSGAKEINAIWLGIKDHQKDVEFLGYEKNETKAKVVSIVYKDKEVAEIKKGDHAYVVTDISTFYGEAGGQQGDTGVLIWKKGKAEVRDTKKYSGIIVHEVDVIEGSLNKGMSLSLNIDSDRRNGLAIHHSATHLLHESLRRYLGDHISQKGSMVAPDRLRFDISHNKPINKEDIINLEKDINSLIRANGKVTTKVMNMKEAEKIGALALFGEKYNEEVRVVSMEDGTQELSEKNSFSIELCGGTHVSNLGEIGLLKIISDTALGSGIRRIEAIAGEAAIKYIQSSNEILNELSSELKVSKEKLIDRVVGFIEERKNLEKKIIELNKKINTSSISQKNDSYSEVSGVKVIAKVLESVSPRDLKGLVDEFKKKIVEGIVIIIGIDKQKASIVVGVTEKLKKEFNAQDLVKIGVKCLGGEGGGGREDLAQGGGPHYSNAQKSLEKIIQEIKNIKS